MPLVKIGEGVRRPDSPPQLFPRDDLTRMFQQNSEDLKWLFPQTDALSVFFAQFSRILVEFEARKTNGGWGGS
jgi:hypothetical protein